MSILTHFNKAQLIALEESFKEESNLHGYYLQQPNEGEGFWLEKTQLQFEAWVMEQAIRALKTEFVEV